MAQVFCQRLNDIDNELAVDAYIELREIYLFTTLKRRRCIEDALFAAVYNLHATRVIDVHVLSAGIGQQVILVIGVGEVILK